MHLKGIVRGVAVVHLAGNCPGTWHMSHVTCPGTCLDDNDNDETMIRRTVMTMITMITMIMMIRSTITSREGVLACLEPILVLREMA